MCSVAPLLGLIGRVAVWRVLVSVTQFEREITMQSTAADVQTLFDHAVRFRWFVSSSGSAVRCCTLVEMTSMQSSLLGVAPDNVTMTVLGMANLRMAIAG